MRRKEFNQEDERIDDLNIKDYKIIQNKKQFCFGMDAVLLSSFTKVNMKRFWI